MANILATVAVLCSLCHGGLSLIQGTRAPRFRYPWYAAVTYDDGVFVKNCGGAILDDRHIATSVLCTGFTTNMKVTVGQYSKRNPTGDEQELSVRRVFEHPDFNFTTLASDIAVVRTNRMTLSTAVQPVILSDSDFDKNPGMDCWLTGFGVTDQDAATTPNILQELPTMVLGRQRCKKMAESKFGLGDRLTKQTLCTRNVYNGPCTGDEGGPLGCYDTNGDYKMLGIMSWGNVNLRKCTHGFNAYTRISQYQSWINGKLN